MTYWPAWLSGLALALVALTHWLAVRRMLAVSGRFTHLVNRLREGPPVEGEDDAMSEAELLAAVQAMALAEFGAEAINAAEAAEASAAPEALDAIAEPTAVVSAGPQPLWLHAAFLAALLVGGVLSALAAGGLTVDSGLASAGFEATFGSGAPSYAVLLLGGVLIGWGTRMSGGCTSGHGLCGVSRAQPGSFVATCAFFGTGIVVSFLLEAVL
ncbi:MAG: hypothetical protein IPL19_25640 [Sandaracinaceae bacterium]|jgi:hypothetical protein|nr:hypothetical protein [Sandaracinaceae bacterium]MBK8411336.1 hypothetical protein [Sandaracinaceae bacterium]MBK8592648.1 hypothetical protein [Sandaracinaceae bacterium]MBP7683690.1 hypothetical protein [Deltaproteobacteria bacterium]